MNKTFVILHSLLALSAGVVAAFSPLAHAETKTASAAEICSDAASS
jgi:hypothetical protein